ncbi:MAG: hypothetical protein JW738_07545, partial [Actinobacteria bacterium]|nr:hypothetical protein [Actinomycetota bacterium]
MAGDKQEEAKKENIVLKYRSILLPLLVFLICLSVYGSLHLLFMARNEKTKYPVTFITEGDEVNYLVMTESLIEDHDVSLLNNYFTDCYERNSYYQVEIRFPYKWETTLLLMVPGSNGRMVLMHWPFLSMVLVPGFRLFGYAGAAGTMILITALAAMLVFLVLRRFCREKIAFITTLAFFLTYPLVTYSRLIYDATIAVFLISFALWSALRLKETGRWFYAVLAALPAVFLLHLHSKYFLVLVALLYLTWSCSANRKRDLTIWMSMVAASAVILVMYIHS